MEVVVERCAGIDVHKDMVAVCVRVPGLVGSVSPSWLSSPRSPGSVGVRDWLVAHG